jgi:hypothetical protein
LSFVLFELCGSGGVIALVVRECGYESVTVRVTYEVVGKGIVDSESGC